MTNLMLLEPEIDELVEWLRTTGSSPSTAPMASMFDKIADALIELSNDNKLLKSELEKTIPMEVAYEPAPAAWAPYFINGDDSSMSHFEIAYAESWLRGLRAGYETDKISIVATDGDEYVDTFEGVTTSVIDYVVYFNA